MEIGHNIGEYDQFVTHGIQQAKGTEGGALEQHAVDIQHPPGEQWSDYGSWLRATTSSFGVWGFSPFRPKVLSTWLWLRTKTKM